MYNVRRTVSGDEEKMVSCPRWHPTQMGRSIKIHEPRAIQFGRVAKEDFLGCWKGIEPRHLIYISEYLPFYWQLYICFDIFNRYLPQIQNSPSSTCFTVVGVVVEREVSSIHYSAVSTKLVKLEPPPESIALCYRKKIGIQWGNMKYFYVPIWNPTKARSVAVSFYSFHLEVMR